jgi:hypothetical protein
VCFRTLHRSGIATSVHAPLTGGALVDQEEEKIDASGSMLTPDAMDKTINPTKTIVVHTMNFKSDAIG